METQRFEDDGKTWWAGIRGDDPHVHSPIDLHVGGGLVTIRIRGSEAFPGGEQAINGNLLRMDDATAGMVRAAVKKLWIHRDQSMVGHYRLEDRPAAQGVSSPLASIVWLRKAGANREERNALKAAPPTIQEEDGQ